jgi:hypothetical protein
MGADARGLLEFEGNRGEQHVAATCPIGEPHARRAMKRAQQLAPRPVRGRLTVRAAPPRDAEPRLRGCCTKCLRQARFANARLAEDERGSPTTGACVVQERQQSLELLVTPDQLTSDAHGRRVLLARRADSVVHAKLEQGSAIEPTSLASWPPELASRASFGPLAELVTLPEYRDAPRASPPLRRS